MVLSTKIEIFKTSALLRYFYQTDLLWALLHLKYCNLTAELRYGMRNKELEFLQFLSKQNQEFLQTVKG